MSLFEYLSNPIVYRFEPGEPISAEKARELAIERAQSTNFLAVVLKSTQKLVGHLYFKQIEPQEFSTWELGYIFNPAFQNRGYATEAAGALIQYGFQHLGIHRVVAHCNPENVASWRVLEKIGLKREGYLRKNVFFQTKEDGSSLWQDSLEYACLKEDILPNQKTLFMLIGPKGSGKTHIGTIVNRHTDIVFLRVEPIWLALNTGEEGWEKVEENIDAMFQEHDKIMVESLGVGEGFDKFHASLAQKYSIKMIRVYADLETCFTRVKNRNNAEHIPVSDDRVVEFNKIAAAVIYDWDIEINNNDLVSDADIINAIQSINK
jgi:RimJ/RimL family protein N-acetyltransferase/shikimate kinase